MNGKELLPDQASLTLCHVETGNPTWMIKAAASQEAANCPDCKVLSTALVCFQTAFKNRILYPYTVVLADLGNLAKSALVHNIVGADGQHLVFSARVAALFARGWSIGKGLFPPGESICFF